VTRGERPDGATFERDLQRDGNESRSIKGKE